MKKRITFNISFTDCDEVGNEIPIPEDRADIFMQAIRDDVAQLPSGLENWFDYTVKISNIGYEDLPELKRERTEL
jgi:hypothetical protein